MIKSKHNTFGFWLLAIASLGFFILVVSVISQWYFGFKIINFKLHDEIDVIMQLMLMIPSFFLFLGILLYKVRRISIDQLEKTILFKNLLFPFKEKYLFDEIDGYVDTIVKHNNRSEYKCLCLVKDRQIVKKIDSFYYSNIEDIQAGLQNIKYLGFVKSDFFNITELDN